MSKLLNTPLDSKKNVPTFTLLYKENKDINYEVEITQKAGKVNLLFSSDCGKFGTDEILDEHNYSPEYLLQILQEYEKQTDYKYCKE